MRVLMAVDDSGPCENLVCSVAAGFGMRIRRSWFYMCCNQSTLCLRRRWLRAMLLSWKMRDGLLMHLLSGSQPNCMMLDLQQKPLYGLETWQTRFWTLQSNGGLI